MSSPAADHGALEPASLAHDPLETVLRTARLARLELAPGEAERLGGQFARILDAFRVLTTLDVEGVPPMTGPTALSDVKREDRARPSLPLEEALANAPARIDAYYSVPKTVGTVGGEL